MLKLASFFLYIHRAPELHRQKEPRRLRYACDIFWRTGSSQLLCRIYKEGSHSMLRYGAYLLPGFPDYLGLGRR